jgi:transposase
VWDGLPAHRSRVMRAWLRCQRHWLVVEPLAAYAPELNPVEALWASLKGVELANLAGEASTRSLRRPSVASNASATPTTWPTRSCGTAACRFGE